MYTLETLAAINSGYLAEHFIIRAADIEKVNALIVEIERKRDMQERQPTPTDGDIVICERATGEIIASSGHLENASWAGGMMVCIHPFNAPFIFPMTASHASGGPWIMADLEKMEYIGKQLKTFCTWSTMGARKNGALDFQAEVNVWKMVEQTRPVSALERATIEAQRQEAQRRNATEQCSDGSWW